MHVLLISLEHMVPGVVVWPCSRVGASHMVNLITPFPTGQNCPKKIYILWLYRNDILMADIDFLHAMRSHGIMGVAFINLDWRFVLMNKTTVIL